MKKDYLEIVSLIERLHRLFLEVIHCELDNLGIEDISNVQALILYNLGEEHISIGELTLRGCYLGSNVSYNLKKMVQNGYVEQSTSKHDKRSFLIKLSTKGKNLCKRLDEVFDKHIQILQRTTIKDIEHVSGPLRVLGEFWTVESSQKSRFTLSKNHFTE